MKLNEMEKRMLYQTEGNEKYAILHELAMSSRYAQNPDRRKAADSLIKKLDALTDDSRYRNISHVAIYAGNGYLVDASSSKGYVVFRPVYSTGKIVMCGRPSWL